MDAITALAAFGILNLDDDLVDAALSEMLNAGADERRQLDPTNMVDHLLVQNHLSKVGS